MARKGVNGTLFQRAFTQAEVGTIVFVGQIPPSNHSTVSCNIDYVNRQRAEYNAVGQIVSLPMTYIELWVTPDGTPAPTNDHIREASNLAAEATQVRSGIILSPGARIWVRVSSPYITICVDGLTSQV